MKEAVRYILRKLRADLRLSIHLRDRVGLMDVRDRLHELQALGVNVDPELARIARIKM